MTKLFLSYRRSDSESITRRIHKALETHFGVGNVFIDADLGAGDFLINVMAAINAADACIVVIGTGWLNATDPKTGEQRLFQLKDVVRREVEQALVRPLTVMMLVQGASVPAKEALPETIEHLPKMNAFNVRDDEHLEADVARIARKINQFLVPSSVTTEPAPVTRPVSPPPAAAPLNINEVTRLFYRHLDDHQWTQARTVLETLRTSGKVSATLLQAYTADLDEGIAAEANALAAQRFIEERDEHYQFLVTRAGRPNPRGIWEALQEFWGTYPGYDPDTLAARFRPSIDKILPAPFQLIAIPGSTGKEWWRTPYQIAKYPVTNAQFAPFITAGGYRERRWWTDAGWEAREKGWVYDGGWKPSGKAWTEPRYWVDAKWNGAAQPVVGVSWYEALAYCTWLSDLTGEKITLPTEDQWQYAAQGDDGRAFPWGNEWDCTRCNNSVEPCKSKGTTPVTHYQGKGDSPFGVTDMAGNVWEWCLTDYKSESNDITMKSEYRVLRGGSWDIYAADYFRCDNRNWVAPHYGYSIRGFRFVLS